MLKICFSPDLVVREGENVIYEWWHMVYKVMKSDDVIKKGKIIIREPEYEEIMDVRRRRRDLLNHPANDLCLNENPRA
jgi:hypothetical protein